MPRTTASNEMPPHGAIADFYVFNEKHELQRRVLSEAEMLHCLNEHPGWYARIVVYANQPPIVLAECPHCGQLMSGQIEKG